MSFRLRCKRIKSYKYCYLNDNLSSINSMMLDLVTIGVGFTRSSTQIDFYSHEGEFIGTVHKHLLDSLIRYLRVNFQIEKDRFPWDRKRELVPPVTYGHGAIQLPCDYDDILQRYHHSPVYLK